MASNCPLCGRRVQKRDNGLFLPFCLGESCPPALTLMPHTSVPPHMPLVPFKLLPWCWSSGAVSLSKSMCALFKRNCLELQLFLLPTQSPLVFSARSYGDLSSWHWNPGLGLLTSEVPLREGIFIKGKPIIKGCSQGAPQRRICNGFQNSGCPRNIKNMGYPHTHRSELGDGTHGAGPLRVVLHASFATNLRHGHLTYL